MTINIKYSIFKALICRALIYRTLVFRAIIVLAFSVLMVGCYSFTGGSIPEYLKTLQITNVNDNSGFGNPLYREEMSRLLITKFRNDNSFSLTESVGDARLTVSIASINDMAVSVRPGELEKERKVTVVTKAEYYDNVNKKVIWSRNFDNFSIYEVTNVQENRNREILRILEQTSNDILLAVVSGW